MTGVSIVVPVYNALDDARRCIQSVYASRTSVEFETIVVDNGSRPDVAEWLAQERKRRPNLHALRFEEPLGFGGAVNQGVRRAERDYLALLNSDTLVTDGWLDLLAEQLERDPALGIVSPVTNRCGHEVQRDSAARLLEADDAGRYAAALGDREQVLAEAQRLVFFCVLLRRTLWDQLGGFDEVFRTGNFEDDDFCLRARLAGYRMGVVPRAFVFHSERRTFDANRLNHGEWLAQNEAVFGARLSRWSRTLRPAVPQAATVGSISVIVPVMDGREGGLHDSLASLANQTVQGFETVVVSRAGAEVPSLGEFSSRLRITRVSVREENASPAALLNAGLAAASGSEIAYLPASDIFYPFHLEVLAGALPGVDAVYSAWSVAISSAAGERRSRVSFPEAEPGIELGDWAPLLCWLHRRRALAFDAGFGAFAPWAYLLQLRDSARARYLCRVTCERRPDAPSAGSAADAQRVMARFPVHNTWQQSQRQQFLEAVGQGDWEDRLIISRNDRARRARRLLMGGQGNGLAPADPAELERLRSRLEQHTSAIEPVWRDAAKPDIFLFSILEWTALTQRPHHFAQGLAARGHRVFWVDARLQGPEQIDPAKLVRELAPGIYQLHLPAVRGEIYRLEWSPPVLQAMLACFTHLRAAFGISRAWQLVNFPRWEPMVTCLRRRFQWPVVYDCLDDQAAFAELFGHHLGQSEKLLIESSSKLLVSGRVLGEAQRKLRPDAILIPNAADFDLFQHARPAGWLDHLPRPIAGFFGAFADWLDFDWMEAAAARFPEWSFVYVGRESFARPAARQAWKNLSARPNVHVFPQAPPQKLAQFLAQMDVCTLPFQDLPITRSMNAVKVYEYLAAGKPVVAANLPETQPLGELGLIATYRTHEQSFEALEEAVRTGANAPAVTARLRFAEQNTWARRVEQLCAALGLGPAPTHSGSEP